MPTSSFEDIFNSDALTEAEKQRLKKIAAGIDRNSRLGIVAAMSSDEGLQRIASPMIQGARDDRVQYAAKFDAEREAAAKLAETLQRSLDREEDRAFRKQQQADLQDYRRQSLGAQAAARASGGRITPYQQAQLDLQREKLTAAQQAKAEAAQAKKLATLSSSLANSGMAELNQSVHDVNATLGKYAGKDIPGVGGLSNVPLIGRFSGGEEGKNVRAQIAAVRNALLKARSGGAVTESEAARMEEELGTMLGATDETLRSTWPKFAERYNAQLGNILAPYQDVLPDYQKSNPRFKGYVDASAVSVPSGVNQTSPGRNRGEY